MTTASTRGSPRRSCQVACTSGIAERSAKAWARSGSRDATATTSQSSGRSRRLGRWTKSAMRPAPITPRRMGSGPSIFTIWRAAAGRARLSSLQGLSPNCLIPAVEPLEGPREERRLREVELDPAPAREPPMGAHRRVGQGTGLVALGQPDPQVVVLGPQGKAGEELVAHEVPPAAEHRSDPHVGPLRDDAVQGTAGALAALPEGAPITPAP